MTPKTPGPTTRKLGHRPSERARRIYIPLPEQGDPAEVRRRNLMAVRRRVDNALRKLYEAQVLLGDAPAGIPPSARETVAEAFATTQRATRLLALPRGRPPKTPMPKPPPANMPDNIAG